MRKETPHAAHGGLNENLEIVDEAIQRISRRRRLNPEEREELASVVKLKLIERQKKIFGKYRGESSLRTYLLKVVDRVFLDWRISRWGKWRPSAAARKAGERHQVVERLLYRERYSLSEAVQILKIDFQWSLTSTEINDIAMRVPAKQEKRLVPLEGLNVPADTGNSPEDLSMRPQRCCRRREIEEMLGQAYSLLTPEERALLRMRFKEGLSIAQISRRLGLEQRRLYRSFNTILRRLRGFLEAKGLHRSELALLIGRSSGEFRAPFSQSSNICSSIIGTSGGQ